MHRKIISAAMAVLLVSGLGACGKDQNTEPSTTASPTTTAIATTTTLPATTTTTQAPTTTTTTKKVTTTKKATTTKKVTTTQKLTTTREETVAQSTTEKKKYRSEEDTFTEMLRYGVIRTRTVKRYYEILTDGSEVMVEERIMAEIVNRLGYSASYTELLPAAKENRETYRDYINKILKITNEYRAEGGLEPLELDEKLCEIACVRAEELAYSALHEHTRPGLKTFKTIFEEGGVTKGVVGENIGWGYPTPEKVCQAWKDSKTHYENIMNPDFVKVGFGVAADPDTSGKFCWVQHFWDGKEV